MSQYLHRLPSIANTISTDEVHRLVSDAYIFGYPLVLMDAMKRATTAGPTGADHDARVNRFLHARTLPDHRWPGGPLPNGDGLQSEAWLDLGSDAVILTVPDMDTRHHTLYCVDAWTNVFASLGTRARGNGQQDFAIVGPRWKGWLPAGVHQIDAPTNMVRVVSRIQTDRRSDYRSVHALQQRMVVTPVNGPRKSAESDEEMAGLVVERMSAADEVAAMSATAFFSRMNALLAHNPPADRDAAVVRRCAAIGIGSGVPFDAHVADPLLGKIIEGGVLVARAYLDADTRMQTALTVNGWTVLPLNIGRFGIDYHRRALMAMNFPEACLAEDVICSRTVVDADGEPLSGDKPYVVRFRSRRLPPAHGFWSLSMYNAQHTFVRNPIWRYAIGSRDQLQTDSDGSLLLYIQHESPGARKAHNWLPAPPGRFTLTMRLYWPKREMLQGSWVLPPVERVAAAEVITRRRPAVQRDRDIA